MEDTLRVAFTDQQGTAWTGLNPCFNGRYSQRWRTRIMKRLLRVLILVLMEDTLRGSSEIWEELKNKS